MIWRCLSLALLFSFCFAGAARADAVSPEVFACSPGSLGSPCSYYKGSGTCQNATCWQKDMANWNPDASAYPPLTSYDCLSCVVTEDSSGCAIGGRLARTVGPWLVAGLFGACVMLARRRPRR